MKYRRTEDGGVARRSDGLVVPGQGSFGAFAAGIDRGGLRETLLEHVRAGKPYLGICLGLQILFEESEEAPSVFGLGLLRGKVRRLAPRPDAGQPRPLPHIGWNVAEPVRASETIVARDHYYFAHSYAAAPSDEALTVATTDYGERFTSAVRKDNVFGVQFHPEKSQRAGLGLLERFFASLRGAS